MITEQYSKRLKNVFVLYVNVFPFIIDKNEIKFLLMKRSSDVVMEDVWQPVSGKIKENESIKEAFFRQVEIKTGPTSYEIYRSDKVHFYYDDYYDCVMSVPFAACRLHSEKVTLDKKLHVEYKWATISEFKELNPFQAHYDFAKQIRDYFCDGKNTCGFGLMKL